MTVGISASDVRRWFEEDDPVEDADMPEGEPLQLLAELAESYRKRRVLGERTRLALWASCSRSDICWPAALDDQRPCAADGQAAISLPWIGPRYRPGGVVVLGMNLRNGGLLEEYIITARTAGDEGMSQISGLEHGKRRIHGSMFAYRSARSAAAALAYVNEERVRDVENPEELASVLERVARLQAVKCSPQDGGRNSPTAAMTVTCPNHFLAHELEILRPAVVVAVGDPAYRAVLACKGYREQGYTESLEWGDIPIGNRSCEIFSLYHPASYVKWAASHRELVAELQRRRAIRR